MPVSPAIRFLQIFAGLGSVATTPFAVKFASKQEVIGRGGGGRQISYKYDEPEIKAEQETTPTKQLKSTEVVDEAQKMMDSESKKGGEKRCFWWPTGTARGLELLACVYMSELNKVFLFHYDAKSQLKLPKQLNLVERLTHNSSGVYMYIQDSQSRNMSHNVKLVFAWLRKWEIDLIPKEHCKLAKNDGKENYTLTCDSERKGTEGKLFSNNNISLETLYKSRHETKMN